MSGGFHHFSCRVYWEDTDAGGIVYYANYLKFAERARTEMLRSRGIGQEQLRHEAGILFAVRRCAVDYLSSARLDDLLDIESRISAFGGASVEFEQAIRCGERVLARLSLRVACIDPNGKPTRLPAALRQELLQYLQISPSHQSQGER